MLFHVVVLLRGWLCERAGYLKTLDTLLVRQTALIIAWIDNRESVWWFDGITPASRQILSSKGVCRRRRDIGTMEPHRFNRRSAHTIRGRQQFKEDYTVYKNHLYGCKRKRKKKQDKKRGRGMAARRVRVYTTCALPLLWPPPLQPEYLLLQVYTHSLLLLIISSSFRLAELPCYSEASVVSFHVSLPRYFSPYSSILLLVFLFTEPFFFATWFCFLSFILFPSVLLVSCMCTWLDQIARRDKKRKK